VRRGGAHSGGAGIDGAIVIDKPVGPTSFAVMRAVERRLGAARAGHAGTLDPLASGVLLVLLGEGTKLSALLMEHDKAYRATITLGRATTTLDAAGETVAEAPVPPLDEAVVRGALAGFVGEHLQVPPAYSAIKKDGRSLMARARAGEEDIPLTPRPVVCHGLELVSLDPLVVDVACGKGYYVRSLARDLATALGTVGHLAGLVRTRLGAFDLGQAVAPDAAGPEHVLPLTHMVPGLATLTLDPVDAAHVAAGRVIHRPDGPAQAIATDPSGRPLAWVRRVDPSGAYRVERGFVVGGQAYSR